MWQQAMQEMVVEAPLCVGGGQEHHKEIKPHDLEVGGIWEVMGKQNPGPRPSNQGS